MQFKARIILIPVLKIELLEMLIPVEEYRVLRGQFVELKAQYRTMHAHVKRLRDKNKPAHDLLE